MNASTPSCGSAGGGGSRITSFNQNGNNNINNPNNAQASAGGTRNATENNNMNTDPMGSFQPSDQLSLVQLLRRSMMESSNSISRQEHYNALLQEVQQRRINRQQQQERDGQPYIPRHIEAMQRLHESIRPYIGETSSSTTPADSGTVSNEMSRYLEERRSMYEQQQQQGGGLRHSSGFIDVMQRLHERNNSVTNRPDPAASSSRLVNNHEDSYLRLQSRRMNNPQDSHTTVRQEPLGYIGLLQTLHAVNAHASTGEDHTDQSDDENDAHHPSRNSEPSQ